MFLALLLAGGSLQAAEDLEKLILEKNWPALEDVFSDDSHLVLRNYLADAGKIVLEAQGPETLFYQVKFSTYAETGNIFFSRKEGFYHSLSIANQIKPFHFFSSFLRYRLKNYSFAVGDARITLQDGYLYEPQPAGRPWFFIGRWNFFISPEDEEERLTLQRRYRGDSFSRDNQWGVFLLADNTRPPALGPAEEPPEDDLMLLLPLLRYVQDYFGVFQEDFKEYWYLSAGSDANLVFFEDTKRSYFLYDFNPVNTPDTRLTQSQGSKIILSYNAQSGPKLRFGSPLQLERLSLNLHYNPFDQSLAGTASLTFDRASAQQTLFLDEELSISAVLGGEKSAYNLFRKDDRYFVRGPEQDRIAFYYRGRAREDNQYSEFPVYATPEILGRKIDEFYFLSRHQNFYPNPGIGFFKSQVTVSVPYGMQVLASGQLIDQRIEDKRLVSQFRSPGSKGFSLVSGSFHLARELKSRIPLKIYCARDFKYHSYLNVGEMKSGFDFLIDLFGMLDVPEVNLLLRRFYQEGGSSLQGFVLLNVDPAQKRNLSITSPVVFSGTRDEYLVHELAHQWWGGLVSWDSYRDVWITEGMAQFAVLSYLEAIWPAARFDSLLRRVRRGVVRDSQAGPPIYGLRIANLEDNLELYQSVVYNKSALVLMMLRELLGPAEFQARVQSLLAGRRYQNISSRQFTDHFSSGDPEIAKFFRDWIYSRRLPEISTRIEINGNQARLNIIQKDTDYIFPLQAEIVLSNRQVLKIDLVMRGASQEFSFSEKQAIVSLRLQPKFAPVIQR